MNKLLLSGNNHRYDLIDCVMKSFLIVENYSPLFRYFKHLISLRYKGATILRANNGKEALEIVKSSDCSVILSEVLMPEVGGIEFYERLKEESPLLAQRLGFITSLESQNLMNYFEQEALPFITKSVKSEELYNLIDGILISEGKRNVGEINYNTKRGYERQSVREGCFLNPLNMEMRNLIRGEVMDVSEGGFRLLYKDGSLLDRLNVKVTSKSLNIIDKKAEMVWTHKIKGDVNAGFRWVA